MAEYLLLNLKPIIETIKYPITTGSNFKKVKGIIKKTVVNKLYRIPLYISCVLMRIKL